MSFGFQFDDSEVDEEYLSSSSAAQPAASTSISADSGEKDAEAAPFASLSMEEMLQHLPSRISFSSINVELAGRVERLLRRDLFDARFQMFLDEEEDDDDAVAGEGEAVAAQGGVKVDTESDLIPGVYEGGLKTWECALDLVETLDAFHATAGAHTGDASWSSRLQGKSVLELGCGTALPSLFILSQVLKDAAPTTEKVGLTLHVADYNTQVLQLVTLPNLILAWYASPAATLFRSGTGADHLRQERHQLSRRGQDHFDTSAPGVPTPQDQTAEQGELSITNELLSAFTSSLASRGIELRFYSGAWSNFPTSIGKVDMILTSETIYSLNSLPALVELLRQYARPQRSTDTATVLVAAKVIYFGVGGGVESFKQTLAQLTPTARVETVHSVTKGVGRTVLSVTF